MSDALCGPSNPLQNFQKHAQTDRTLQQDRLTSRGSPAQGFRSLDRNTGILDPEFEAFQRSQPGLFAFPEQAPLHFQQPGPSARQPAFAGPVDNSGWATDFQRLNLSSPPPIAQQYHAGPSHSQQVPWTQEQGSTARLQNVTNTYRPQFQHGGFTQAFGGYQEDQMYRQIPDNSQTVAQPDLFDEAAFERAFDMAREQLLEESKVMPEESSEQAQIDRSGVDIYPHLPLLRFKMFQSLIHPTEQSNHRLALYFSLLEDHDVNFISRDQAQLFLPILFHTASQETSPLQERYALAYRALALHNKLKERWPGLLEVPLPMAAEYEKALLNNADQTDRAAHQFMNSATDAEMVADLKMQMEELKPIPLERRVFEAFNSKFVPDISTLSEKESELLCREAHAAFNNHAQGPMTQELYEQMVQDPATWLWSLTYHAAESPEVIEARESSTFTASLKPTPSDLMAASRQHFSMTANSTEQNGTSLGMMNTAGDTLLSQPLHSQLASLEPEVLSQLPQDQTIEQQQQQQQTPTDKAKEADDLARVAGELAQKMSSDSSSKFANSTFLSLMRRLRDREIHVEGNDMVESTADKPDYIAPDTSAYASRDGQDVVNMLNNPSERFTHDVSGAAARDGQDVVDMLNDPSADFNSNDVAEHEARDGHEAARAMGMYDGAEDLDPSVMMTSPFFDNEHAELGRRGLFEE